MTEEERSLAAQIIADGLASMVTLIGGVEAPRDALPGEVDARAAARVAVQALLSAGYVVTPPRGEGLGCCDWCGAEIEARSLGGDEENWACGCFADGCPVNPIAETDWNGGDPVAWGCKVAAMGAWRRRGC